MSTIHSVTNPTVKHLVRMRSNRARRRAGEVLTDDDVTTAAAIAAGLKPIAFYVLENHRVAMALPIEPTPVSPAVMRKIAYGQNASTLIGRFTFGEAQQMLDALPPLRRVMVLDRMEKPGNVGAVFRSVDGAGFDAVLLCDGGDPSHPNAVRNSRGASITIPSRETSHDDAIEFLRRRGFTIYAARVRNSDVTQSRRYDQVDYGPPVAIVIGNEADGLGDRFTGPGIVDVHIPMAGRVDSLNAAVTAAVLAFRAAATR